MNYLDDWKIGAVSSWFKDHKAVRRLYRATDAGEAKTAYDDMPDFITVDWRKPGTSQFAIHYAFDVKNASCAITGDLGEAVVAPRGWQTLTPEEFARAFSPNNMRYFDEKLVAKSDHYDWSKDEFKHDLAEEIGKENYDVIDAMAERFSANCNAEYQSFELTGTEREFLSEIDEDYNEWFWTLGRGFSIRVYAWVIGMNMAMEQLNPGDR